MAGAVSDPLKSSSTDAGTLWQDLCVWRAPQTGGSIVVSRSGLAKRGRIDPPTRFSPGRGSPCIVIRDAAGATDLWYRPRTGLACQTRTPIPETIIDPSDMQKNDRPNSNPHRGLSVGHGMPCPHGLAMASPYGGTSHPPPSALPRAAALIAVWVSLWTSRSCAS